MTRTETERLAVLETKVDDLKGDVCAIKDDIKEIKDLIVKFQKEADVKYAPMWLVKAFWGSVGAIMTGVLAIIVFIIEGHIKF